MDILIVAQYLSNKTNLAASNSRFLYLAEQLKSKNVGQVEILTSKFGHGAKKIEESIPTSWGGGNDYCTIRARLPEKCLS